MTTIASRSSCLLLLFVVINVVVAVSKFIIAWYLCNFTCHGKYKDLFFSFDFLNNLLLYPVSVFIQVSKVKQYPVCSFVNWVY